MRAIVMFLSATLVAGCASKRTTSGAPKNSASSSPIVRERPETHSVETRYELRSYRDGDDPAVRHDAHAVYRSTRVPMRVVSLDTNPRMEFAPATYAPLAASAELTAEIAAQKKITADLRAIEAKLAVVQKQAQSHYAALVQQAGDTLKLRQQLEEERDRVRELEAKMRDRAATTAAVPAPTATAETKW